MTLLERYRANLCAVEGCEEPRCPDSDVCKDDLNRKWRNLLVRVDGGRYQRRRELTARDETWQVAA